MAMSSEARRLVATTRLLVCGAELGLWPAGATVGPKDESEIGIVPPSRKQDRRRLDRHAIDVLWRHVVGDGFAQVPLRPVAAARDADADHRQRSQGRGNSALLRKQNDRAVLPFPKNRCE